MSNFLDLIHDPKCKPKFEALLRLAAGRGDVEQVVERLSWGIDPNCETEKGRSPLLCNVVSSNPSSGVVKALLKAGADPHHMDHKGLTALDYANRKLYKLNLKPRKPPRKSPSLDENGQLIVAKFEQQMFAKVRKEHPDWAKEFITDYIKERIKVAKRVFNDPNEVEKIVDLLEAAMKKERKP
jgi:ankyrin repeat protein